MKLYTYFRSSAAFRVRIALALKGLDYEAVPVHLVRNGGEHLSADFAKINPLKRVPALADNGALISQSLAIIDYLDEMHPEPPLLPKGAAARAEVRAAALLIACDIHPLNNSGTLKYLREKLGADQAALDGWYAHWVQSGFAALEQMVRPGPYCFGDQMTLADICLVPQMFNAWRFKVDVSRYPRLNAIVEACLKHPAIAAARPEAQPDAE